jgi:NADH-quinone oxidoreductase subunit M
MMYFLMTGWGTERKLRAARRYLYLALPAMVCVLAGALPGGLVWGGGANPPALPAATSALGFWAMFAGFGILAAVVPAHWWLSDVVTESSTPIALLTVGVMQTLGAYGLLRLGHPQFAGDAHAWPAGLLGAITMAYGALAALGQKNLKRMAAYVSISLMGCVVLGIAMGTAASIMGAVFLLAGHAVGVGMMVFVAGMIQDRLGHTEIERLGGLGGHMPALAGWGAVAFLGAMGLPGLCVFAGEVLVLMGTFERSREGTAHGYVWLGAAGIGSMALLLGCCVWSYQRVFLGAPRPEHSNVARMNVSERWLLAILGLTSVALGILPALLTDAVRSTAEAWLGH